MDIPNWIMVVFGAIIALAWVWLYASEKKWRSRLEKWVKRKMGWW
jgi:type II secretory pathway component PulF